MKTTVLLSALSLLSLFLISAHLADDIVRGLSPGGLGNLYAVAVMAVWLYAALLLPERRSGQIILLLTSLCAAAMPVIHMMGRGVGVHRTEGAFFFIWGLFGLGMTGLVTFVLAIRALRGAK